MQEEHLSPGGEAVEGHWQAGTLYGVRVDMLESTIRMYMCCRGWRTERWLVFPLATEAAQLGQELSKSPPADSVLRSWPPMYLLRPYLEAGTPGLNLASV